MAATSEKGEFSLAQLVDAAKWAWSTDDEREQKHLQKANLPVLKAVLRHANLPITGKKADIISRIATSREQIEDSLGHAATDIFVLVCKCATGLRAGTCQGCTSCTCDKQGQYYWH